MKRSNKKSQKPSRKKPKKSSTKTEKKSNKSRLYIAIVLLVVVLSVSYYYWTRPKEVNEIVVFKTTSGDFEVELNREKAPVTVSNFLRYVEEGFYDGAIFHRVIPGFMIQGGGFTADGVQKETRDPIILESDNGLSNLKGTIAMARTIDPDSATSQFFINLVDNTGLDRGSSSLGYAVFGEVVSGMETVEAIGSVATGSRGPYSDWPTEDVVILQAYLKK